MTEHVAAAPIATRDELHEFIDEIDDEGAKPGLHTAIDTLPDELVPVVLKLMRALRARTTGHPPRLH
jgi:hypothetical protein